MKQRFTTKRDVNGNRYTLIIDHSNKTYTVDYNPRYFGDYIVITKKARRAMIDELNENGYTITI